MGIFENAVARGEEILAYIPQRSPIVMVDAFFGIEGQQSFSGLTVAADNILADNGHLTESGIVEHFAQSCALRVGYACKQQNAPVPVGYIAAIKNMTFGALPQVGDRLQTTVSVVQEVFDITLIEAQTTVNNELIATCEMKIFLKKE